jgi:uncharacterized protein (TIGR02453 family)
MTFRGWPADAFDFYRGLEVDNSKAYWQANKQRYEASVKEPFEALLSELDADYGPFRMFRPYRDTRFSKDKSPYKTAAAASTEGERGTGLYVQISANGLVVGSGYYHMASDQLARFREAVDDDTTGEAIAAICAGLEKAGHNVAAFEELKTAPRGYPKDHPRVDLLRRKGLVAMRTFPEAGWLHTAKAKDRVVETWRQEQPMHDWLDAHVGPSELPPPDADL